MSYKETISEIRNSNPHPTGYPNQRKDVVVAPYLSSHYVYVDGKRHDKSFPTHEEAWEFAKSQGEPRTSDGLKAHFDQSQNKLVWEKAS